MMSRSAQIAATPVDRLALAVVGAALAGSLLGVAAVSPYMAVDIAVLCVGIAATLAAIGLALSSESVRGLGRAEIAGCTLVVWLVVASFVSGRGMAAFLGHPGGGVGALALIAVAVTVSYGRRSSQSVAHWLRVVAPWLVSIEIALVSIQLAAGSMPRGTLPNSSYLAELLVLLLPFVPDPERPRDMTRWAIIALALVGMAAAGARIAFVVALAWGVFEALRVRLAGTRTRTAGLSAGLALLAFGAGWLLARGDFGRWDFASLAGERVAIWRTALDAIAVRPVMGWGADGFAVAGPQMATPALVGQGLAPVFGPLTTDPHNALLWITVAGGVSAALLALWLAVEIAGRVLAHRNTARARSSAVRAAAWAVALYMMLVLTTPMIPQVLPLFALVMGVLLGDTLQPEQRVESRGLTPLLRATTIAAMLLGMLLVGSAALRVSADSITVENATVRAASLQQLADTVRIDPHLYYQAAIQWGYAAGSDPAAAFEQRDLLAINRAVELDGRFYLYELERARTLSFYEAPPQELIVAYESVLDDYPALPEANARLGAEKAQLAQSAEARTHLDLAAAQKPRDAATLAYLARGYGALGERELEEQFDAQARDASVLAR